MSTATEPRDYTRKHPNTLWTAGALASTLSAQGKPTAAEVLRREVVAAERRALGPEHPQTLNSASHLAVTLYNQGKFAEAEPMFREICAFQVRVLGKDHPDTRKTMDNYIACIRSAPDGKDLTSEQMGARACSGTGSDAQWD